MFAKFKAKRAAARVASYRVGLAAGKEDALAWGTARDMGYNVFRWMDFRNPNRYDLERKAYDVAYNKHLNALIDSFTPEQYAARRRVHVRMTGTQASRLSLLEQDVDDINRKLNRSSTATH